MTPLFFLKVKRKLKYNMNIKILKKGATIFGTGSKIMAIGALITFCIGGVCAIAVDVKQNKIEKNGKTGKQ